MSDRGIILASGKLGIGAGGKGSVTNAAGTCPNCGCGDGGGGDPTCTRCGACCTSDQSKARLRVGEAAAEPCSTSPFECERGWIDTIVAGAADVELPWFDPLTEESPPGSPGPSTLGDFIISLGYCAAWAQDWQPEFSFAFGGGDGVLGGADVFIRYRWAVVQGNAGGYTACVYWQARYAVPANHGGDGSWGGAGGQFNISFAQDCGSGMSSPTVDTCCAFEVAEAFFGWLGEDLECDFASSLRIDILDNRCCRDGAGCSPSAEATGCTDGHTDDCEEEPP